MEDSPARDRMILDFNAIVTKLGRTGASNRAAQAILEELNQSRRDEDLGHLTNAN
jgi:hypothetical protein